MPRFLCAAFLTLLVIAPLMAQPDRKEIVLSARSLATPDQRTVTPTPGKWWLRPDAKEWGIERPILLTGEPSGKAIKQGEWVVPAASRFVPYRVPTLEIDPQAKGWYRIHVGLYHDTVDPMIRPQLFARLSREQYPEYLRAPYRTKERNPEVFWKAADLTGQKLFLQQPPAPMPHPGYGWIGGVTHLRLVPMTDAEVAVAKKELELPPREKRLFGMLDYTDEDVWTLSR